MHDELRKFSPGHENCHHTHYLLSCEEYEAMLAACKNRCEICRLPGSKNKGGKLHIDHEHRYTSHAVRGLLCSKCNTLMGRVDAGQELRTKRILDYLHNAWFIRVVRYRPRETKPWRDHLYPARDADQIDVSAPTPELENLMGYYTRFSGEIKIAPPLLWGEIKDSPFVVAGEFGTPDRDCKLRIDAEIVETDEGTLTRKRATAIVCTYDGETKAYRITEHLQELLNLHGKGRTFSGYIEAEREDSGDMWRLAVRDGQAARIEPRIVWPDCD
jgi:hypothetical protein